MKINTKRTGKMLYVTRLAERNHKVQSKRHKRYQALLMHVLKKLILPQIREICILENHAKMNEERLAQLLKDGGDARTP